MAAAVAADDFIHMFSRVRFRSLLVERQKHYLKGKLITFCFLEILFIIFFVNNIIKNLMKKSNDLI